MCTNNYYSFIKRYSNFMMPWIQWLLCICFYKQKVFDGWTKNFDTFELWSSLFFLFLAFLVFSSHYKKTPLVLFLFNQLKKKFPLFKQCSVTIKTMQAWSRQMVQRPSAASVSVKRRERPSRTRIKPLRWMVSSGLRLPVQTTTENRAKHHRSHITSQTESKGCSEQLTESKNEVTVHVLASAYMSSSTDGMLWPYVLWWWWFVWASSLVSGAEKL